MRCLWSRSHAFRCQHHTTPHHTTPHHTTPHHTTPHHTTPPVLKQRGTHPWVLRMAHDRRCSACEESKPPALRHITLLYLNVLGAILERWNALATPGDSSPSSMSVHGRFWLTCSDGHCLCGDSRAFEPQQPNHRVQGVAVERLVCSPWKISSYSNGSRWLLHEQ